MWYAGLRNIITRKPESFLLDSVVAGVTWTPGAFLMEVAKREVHEEGMARYVNVAEVFVKDAFPDKVAMILAEYRVKCKIQTFWLGGKEGDSCNVLNRLIGFGCCLPLAIHGPGTVEGAERLLASLLRTGGFFWNPKTCPRLEAEMNRRKVKRQAFNDSEPALACVKQYLFASEGSDELTQPSASDGPAGCYIAKDGTSKDNVAGWIQAKIDALRDRNACWDEPGFSEGGEVDGEIQVGGAGGTEVNQYLGGENPLKISPDGTFSGRLGSAINQRIANMNVIHNMFLEWLKKTGQTNTEASQKQFFATFMTRIKDQDSNSLKVIFSE